MFKCSAWLTRPGDRIQWDRFGRNRAHRSGNGVVVANKPYGIIVNHAGEERIIPSRTQVEVIEQGAR